MEEETRRDLFASKDEKQLPDFEVEPCDTLRRDGLLFRKLVVRSGRFLPLPVLRLDAPAARRTGRVLLCSADAGKVGLADSTAWLRTQLKHYDTVLRANLRGQGETADPAAGLYPNVLQPRILPGAAGPAPGPAAALPAPGRCHAAGRLCRR
jgi:hypothetical protein